MSKLKSIFLKEKDTDEIPMYKRIINIAIIIVAFVGIFVVSLDGYQMNLGSLRKYAGKILNGYEMTLIISIGGLIVSLLLGTLFAFGLKSRILLLRYFSKIYVEVIRGTPFLVQIIVFFYLITPVLGIENRYVVGVMILAIFSGAYVTEIIRGGIESIEQSQHETAKAVGFTNFQKYRYVIIPQVIRRIMPSLAGQVASLVKDSSLLSVIAISEFTLSIQEVTAINFRTYENYLVLALGYLIITFPISLLSKALERKFNYDS
jgi:polar amino acid transport system permease protein